MIVKCFTMAQYQSTISIRIEPLCKDNYETWKIQVVALLTKSGTWPYVSGKNVKPVVAGEGNALAAAQAALNKWTLEDSLTKSDLILSISSSQLKHVRNCESSRDVWTKLKSIYLFQGPTRKATLLEQLLSQKMREGDDVQDYLSHFMSTVDNLQQMKVEINGDLLTITLLHSLPSSYDNFCCAIKSHDTLPNVEKLMGKIIEESFAREHKFDDSGGAMYANQRRSNSGSQWKWHADHKSHNAPDQRGKIECDFCGKTGHRASRCFKKKRSENQKANSVDDAFITIENSKCHENSTFSAVINGAWTADRDHTSVRTYTFSQILTMLKVE